MKLYLKNFIRYNKTNTVGHMLAMISIPFLLLWAVLGFAIAFMMNDGVFLFNFWAWALPLTFGFLTVAHYIARPAVCVYYATR